MIALVSVRFSSQDRTRRPNTLIQALPAHQLSTSKGDFVLDMAVRANQQFLDLSTTVLCHAIPPPTTNGHPFIRLPNTQAHGIWVSAGKTLKTHARKRILSALYGTLNWEWHEYFLFDEIERNKKDFLWIISWARLVESPCYFDSSRSFRFEKALVIIRYENWFEACDIHNPFWKVCSFHFVCVKERKSH